VLDRLAERLQGELIGKCTTTSWIHGDYSPDNILMASDGSAVRGIIDWELSRSGGLPGLDFVQLMVTFRMARTNRELGEVVRNLIFREDWTPEEQEIFRRMRLHYPGDQIAPRTLLLLVWLLHISANINNSDRFNSHWVWKTANIEPVLRIL
jgi:aminoglycoside phosphotransferase (APT) family kinase protein